MKASSLHGHLDALILSVVEDGPLHGYAIIEALRARSDGALDLPTGTVYPALRRLERTGHLRSEWSNVAGRDRRTYRLTTGGKQALATQRGEWREFRDVVSAVLGTA
ncbi:PadR family transcriptional regulator [Actinorhabdospora filicis]|uniref:PadR family transcriptional regulator n=1 Tax=Actinorhabdospora filicis TaxID=1785913 RepID=A0A9W6SRA1_9ACTN|nr:helix-turn-helix transcriptional regulator [Actinorhabdospora filicis]GLZ80898.1 PadR family transcriptional regulator [Actinorhabdospora filicis]